VTVDPSGRFAYVANFNSRDVSAYAIISSTGALSSVGSKVATGNTPASVTVDPSGRFAYVANEGSNDISAYTINASTGALTSVGPNVAAGTNPISVTVDPSGRFAYVANFGFGLASNDVSAYTINATTGALTSVGSNAPTGRRPVSVATTGIVH
jgi:YVTN family beta-propeller protein